MRTAYARLAGLLAGHPRGQAWTARQGIRAAGLLAGLGGRAALPDSAIIPLWGLRLPGPVGVAAGLDRDARLLPALAALGFATVELGTVNDPAAVDGIRGRIQGWRRSAAGRATTRTAVGVSIGSLRPALDEAAAEDCALLARAFATAADYLVLNLSRPGSPGRTAADRCAQRKAFLARVRDAVRHGDRPVPLLLKVAVPECAPQIGAAAAGEAAALGYEGLVLAFEGWRRPHQGPALVAGLRERFPALALFAVGGIRRRAEAQAFLEAGAAQILVYRALLAHGPRILDHLAAPAPAPDTGCCRN